MYKVLKTKKNLKILIPVNAKPIKFLTQRQIENIDKYLRNPFRVNKIREHYKRVSKLKEQLESEKIKQEK